MKKKNFIIPFLVAILSVSILSSCQSKEEKIISRYESLCDEISDEKDFDEEDFARITEEFNELQEDAKDCEFTSQQEERLIKATGKITAVMAKKMPGMFFKSGGRLLKNAMDFVNGFTDGLTEDIGDIDDAMEDIDDAMEDIDDAMEDIDDAIDEMFDE